MSNSNERELSTFTDNKATYSRRDFLANTLAASVLARNPQQLAVLADMAASRPSWRTVETVPLDENFRHRERPLVQRLKGTGFDVSAQSHELTRLLISCARQDITFDQAVETYINLESEAVKHWSREFAFNRPIFGYEMVEKDGEYVVPKYNNIPLLSLSNDQERLGRVKENMFTISQILTASRARFCGFVSSCGWAGERMEGGQLITETHPGIQVFGFGKNEDESVSVRTVRINTREVGLAELIAHRLGVIKDRPDPQQRALLSEKERVLQALPVWTDQQSGVNSAEELVDLVEKSYREYFQAENPGLFNSMRYILSFGKDLTELDEKVKSITVPELAYLEKRTREILGRFGPEHLFVDKQGRVRISRELAEAYDELERDLGQVVLRINAAEKGEGYQVGQQLTEGQIEKEYQKATENDGCELEEHQEWVIINGIKTPKYKTCPKCGRTFESIKINFDFCPTRLKDGTLCGLPVPKGGCV